MIRGIMAHSTTPYHHIKSLLLLNKYSKYLKYNLHNLDNIIGTSNNTLKNLIINFNYFKSSVNNEFIYVLFYAIFYTLKKRLVIYFQINIAPKTNKIFIDFIKSNIILNKTHNIR